MNSESLNSKLYEASKPASMVTFRNNCGVLKDQRGIPVHFGVGGPTPGKPSKGGSDFIGYEVVIITPEMVGKKVAIFTAHELKADECNEGTATIAAQENFIAQVNEDGGRAGFVRRPIDIELISRGEGCTVLARYPDSRLRNGGAR